MPIMRRQCAVVAGAIVLSLAAAWAPPGTADEIGPMLRRFDGAPLPALRTAGEYFESELGSDRYRKLLVGDLQASGIDEKAMQRVLVQASKIRDEMRLGGMFVKGTGLAIEGSFMAIGTLAGGPAGLAISIGAVKLFSDTLVKQASDKVLADTDRKVGIVLGNRLAELRRADAARYGALFQETELKAFQSKLLGVNQSLLMSDAEWAKLPAEERLVLTHHQSKELQRILVSETYRNQLLNEAHSEGIAVAHEGIRANTKFILSFGRESQKQIQALQAKQEHLVEKMSELSGRTDRNTKDIEFLHGILWGKMGAAEQLEALRGQQWFPNMPAGERARLEQRIEIAKTAKDIADLAGTIAGGAQTMAKLAGQLGVDPALVRGISFAAGAAQAVVNGVASIFSGNIMGALSAVGDLLGLFGGPDIATQRHQEIMGALDHLAKGQQAILKNQEIMLQTQQTIIENQKRIFEAIVKLAEQVERQHDEVMRGLAQVRAEIFFSRRVSLDVLLKDFRACAVFFDSRKDFGFVGAEESGHGSTPAGSGRFASFEHRARHFAEASEEFRRCRQAMWNFKMVGPVTGGVAAHGVSSVFLARSSATIQNGIAEYVDQVYVPTWNYTLGNAGFPTPGDLAASLMLPLAFFRETLAGPKSGWWRSAEAASVAGRNAARWLPSAALGQALVDDEVLEWAVGYLQGIIPYLDWIDPLSGRLYTKDDLLRGADPKGRLGMELLRSGLRIADIGVAQQSILAGESLVPALLERMDPIGISNDPKAGERIRAAGKRSGNGWRTCETGNPEADGICVLAQNRLLARNFLVAAVRRALARAGRTMTAYAFGLGEPEPMAIETALGKWPLERHAAKDGAEPTWHLVLPAPWEGQPLRLELPRAEDVRRGEILYAPAMERLLATKGRLAEALMERELPGRLAPQDRRWMERAALYGAFRGDQATSEFR